MYSSLLFFHSLFRWLVLVSLLYAIGRAYRGYTSDGVFTKTDNSARHWTATIAHSQLVIGFTLYFTSPIIKYFFANFKQESQRIDLAFFGIIHFLLMLTAIVVITIGSALAKRKPTDKEKFRTMLVWFSIALGLIFLAILWPFSPLANRPYFRPY
ncbi:hypothetical protein [Spirosoma validum]|uniref:Cytochrome B n=1 Tax=Spirosoma validum TaxID=2771355 RepID=A0A927GFP9_9BACT|nr:hypothetical protein [Spirosoma validum]MBD2755903.1 hypothetical protein [Spirosoma validum]